MSVHSIVSGSALELMKLVANNIENVNHRFEAYPIRRSWQLIKNTKQDQLAYCFWGASYKKERRIGATLPNQRLLPYLTW